MNPVFAPFANHLWQSTLFAAVAGMLTLILRHDRARVRHSIWLAASLKFLVPFSVLMALGNGMAWRTAPESVSSNLAVIVGQVSQPFPPTHIATPPLNVTPAPTDWLTGILCSVWACGFLGIAGAWRIRWRRIKAAVRAGTPVQVGVGTPALSSPSFLEPGVFGVFGPVLLLPEGIFDRLTPAQLQAVIAHELCHIRHRDNLAAAIHMFVESLFWFHPVLWWMGKRMIDERERACDEEVLRLGNEPRVYAEGILKICRLYVESPLACVPGVTGSNLNRRIDAILANPMIQNLGAVKKTALAFCGAAALLLPVAIGIVNAPPVEAQAVPAATPKFEVASIRPCKSEPGRMRGSGNSSPGRLSTGCDLLVDENNLGLVQRAYVRFAGGHINPLGVLAIKGGPAWIRSDMYRIEARAEGQPTREMIQGPMLQALLEDRFRLKVHRETKEGPVYELIAVKDGSKLKPFEEGSCTQMPLTFPVPPAQPGQRYCKTLISLLAPSIDAEGSTLAEFSKLLNLVLDRPVIDKTGLPSRFNIHLKFSRNESTPGLREPVPDAPSTASDPSGPTIFTAIQEQLGLKLVASKGPVEFMVIDHVERPTEN